MNSTIFGEKTLKLLKLKCYTHDVIIEKKILKVGDFIYFVYDQGLNNDRNIFEMPALHFYPFND